MLELVYTAVEMAPFARDCGYDGEPFIWNPKRCAILRAELDALFFHLYGLNPEDTEHVLGTFPVLQKNESRRFREYRTRRLALQANCAMGGAIEGGPGVREVAGAGGRVAAAGWPPTRGAGRAWVCGPEPARACEGGDIMNNQPPDTWRVSTVRTMARTLAPSDLPPKPASAPNRIRWTRRQCDAIRDAGILTGRYELIDGEILTKMPQKPPHAGYLRILMAWLVGLFGADRVSIQSTIDVSAASPLYDEPEPDAAVTSQPAARYLQRHPAPADLELVAEVSDSSLDFDLTTKADLYARAGIREYWVLDVIGRRLFVHRRPAAGRYEEITEYGQADTVAALARPDKPVAVADLMPPADADSQT